MNSNVELNETKSKTNLAVKLLRQRKGKTEGNRIIKAEGIEYYPLSYSQKRFWFLDKLNNDSGNNIFYVKRFHNADLERIQWALERIFSRHDIWKVQIKILEGEPVQSICHDRKVPVIIKDLQSMKTSKKHEFLQEFYHTEMDASIDMEHEPLARVHLFIVSEKEIVLTLLVNHIIFDGWSLSLFEKELAIFYEKAFQEDPLPELPIQFVDFCKWEKDSIHKKFLDDQLIYWLTNLKDTPVLELPTDYIRPAVRTNHAGNISFVFTNEESSFLRNLAKQNNSTLFIVILTLYAVLLNKYSGQEDFCIGSPSANRKRNEVRDLIGVFINMLPIRVRIDEGYTFAMLLEAVKKTTLEAYEHQEYPFEKIVEALQPERDLSRTPIFQVTYNMQNDFTRQETEFESGYEDYSKILAQHKIKNDLAFVTMETQQDILGNFVYNTDLFNEFRIKQFIGHLKKIITEIKNNPDIRLSHLNLQTIEERNLISRIHKNKISNSDSIQRLFEKVVIKNKKRQAVVFENKTLTYDQLNKKANKIAHFLIKKGAKVEDRIGLFLNPSLELAEALLGILKAGGAYVPFDTKLPLSRVETMIIQAEVKLIISTSDFKKYFEKSSTVEIIYIDELIDTLEAFKAENPTVKVNPENLMYVIFTSGTTGIPKGIQVEHRNYYNYLKNVLERLHNPVHKSFALVSTFAADLGTIMIWAALTRGGTIHLMGFDKSIDPNGFSEYMHHKKIDIIKIVPSHLEAMMKSENPIDCIPRKILILAGEACSWDLVQKIRKLSPKCEIQNHYGPTETTVSVLTYKIDKIPEKLGYTSVPLGFPLANTRTLVLDKNHHQVPIGIPGELYISGASVSRGYVGDKKRTAEVFLNNPNASNEIMYKTGDKVARLPDGAIQFLGRMDHQIKIRGYRIDPEEIDYHLRHHSTILESITVLSLKSNETFITSYVVIDRQKENDFSVYALTEYLKSRLPNYMIPKSITVIDKIPLNANGKIDRKSLPDPVMDMEIEREGFIAPRDDIEKNLSEIWLEVLGVKASIDDNFFDIGGDSFKAISVISKIRPKISVIQIFNYPTIRELADFLRTTEGGSRGLLFDVTYQKDVPKKAAIITIPFGGGNAITFQPLSRELSPDFSMYALQLPGHDVSLKDEGYMPIKELALKCADEIEAKINLPLYIYGHCINGALALEISRILESRKLNLKGIIMAGIFPNARIPGKLFKLMDHIFPVEKRTADHIYRDTVSAFGGFSNELTTEEKDVMIKALKNDAKEGSRYFNNLYEENAKKLKAPILTVVGEQDRMTEYYEERYREWGDYTDKIKLAIIKKAGHYFHKYQPKELAAIIHDFTGITDSKDKKIDDNISILPMEDSPDCNRQEELKKGVVSFFVIAIGQLVSMLGTQLTSFALGIWVYQQTGNISDFAFIAVFALVPGILLLPMTGAVVDRLDRKKIIVLSDVFAAMGTIFLITIFLMGQLQLWHIYLVSAIGSIANAFQQPAYLASIPQLIPKRFLGHANGIVQLSMSMGGIVAPILGGYLIGLIGIPGIITIDLITFVFATVTLSLTRFPNKLFRKSEEPFFKEIKGGFKYIFKRKSLISMIIFFMVVNFIFSLSDVLVVPLILSFANTAELGFASGATSAGLIIGAFIMSLWGGTKDRTKGMIGFIFLTAAAIIVTGFRPYILFPFFGLLLYGIALSLINAHWQSLIQVKVGVELQGRVFAANQMMAWLMRPLSYIVASPFVVFIFKPFIDRYPFITDIIGAGEGREIGLMLVGAGIVLLLWTIIGFSFKSLRNLNTLLPDVSLGQVIEKDKDLMQQWIDNQYEGFS